MSDKASPTLGLEELDLSIPDMDSPVTENAVKNALQNLPGVSFVRLIERGAFVRYQPNGISVDEICTSIRNAGFRASVFQDSKSGRTGLSSQ